jgi:multidrug efflux pump subunit AcrB
MVRNPVAANLLMMCLVVGGLLAMFSVKQEVFPTFEMDMVVVTVAYPGASPSEVEQGVVLALEEAVRGVDGVKEVHSTASEHGCLVMLELSLGTASDRALADVKSAVDRITSFPKEIERPIVSLATNRKEVVTLVVFGDKSEHALRKLAEKMREDLVAHEDISVVELSAVRPLEISIEVNQAELRRYGLTLDALSQIVRQASVELPGGGIKTAGGEVLIRTTERRRTREDFEQVIVLSQPDGSEVRLGQIATVDDGFQDTDQSATFNGLRAAMVKVFRVGAETPTAVSRAVSDYAAEQRPVLPAGVQVSTWTDMTEWYESRLDLLRRNAVMGLVLVMLVLALLLEWRLAFWVTLGIPVSFIGSMIFLPPLDASFNMISMFAFIVTLGMVVDDAIVVGEAIFKKRSEGMRGVNAAIAGVKEVAVPVVFAILTTVIAFAPMLFVPGAMGKFFRLIPIVVIAVLLLSLVESLLILPAHLAHSKPPEDERGGLRWLSQQQARFSKAMERFIAHRYVPVVKSALVNRYLVIATGIAILLSSVGLVAGGRINFTFLPKVEGDIVIVDIRLPYGAPVAETEAIVERVVQAGQSLLDEYGGEEKFSRGLFAQVGARGSLEGGDRATGLGPTGSHLAEAAVYLVELTERPFTAKEFANKWRERVGDIPGLEHLKFVYDVAGPSPGAAVHVELAHERLDVLERAAAELASQMREYAGVFDIDDGFSPGKEQLDFRLKPEARALGLTEQDLARQVRAAFYGAEAVREQRGRDEVRVYLRLPEAERRSEHDIESFVLRTPGGGEIPLGEAAEVVRGRSFTEITRREGRRVVGVTAEVEPTVTNAGKVLDDIKGEVLPLLETKYKGLKVSFEGAQASQRETMSSLGRGFIFALFGIFTLLAVIFRSYYQPLIIMLVIPFGFIGAVIGHAVMGFDLSMMSMMGIVALSGVVVNDSLILVVAVNNYRKAGYTAFDAIWAGSARRFRPIILTSLTTFLGLMPIILETSAQARFLIPMAISLGFGVLFATIICLILVPAVYAAALDIRRLFGIEAADAPEDRPAGAVPAE